MPIFQELHGYTFDLLNVATFSSAALLVVWIWWAVPKWQVAVTFVSIGALLCAATVAGYFMVKVASEQIGWGPMQRFLLVIPLAPRLGVLAGGLASLFLGIWRKDVT